MKKFNFSFIVIALIASLMISCNKDGKESVSDLDYAPYINAYTGGIILTSSPITVELAQKVEGIQPGEEADKKIFSFSPSIKGKAYWASNRVISFIPEENALKGGQQYKAELKLGELMEVPKKFEKFKFTFYVEGSNFIVQTYPIEESGESADLVRVKGEVNFSKDVTVESVIKMISAKTTDNQKVSVAVETTEDPSKFRYIIDNIQKKDTDINLNITFDGKPVDSDKKETVEVLIPQANVFKLLSAEVVYDPEFYIQLAFSDPVSASQDLTGLITIAELSSGYTMQVKDNKVNIYLERYNMTDITIQINQGLKNTRSKYLDDSYSESLKVAAIKPQVELLTKGTILPNSKDLKLPFRAVNLRAVDIKVIQVFENNILAFFQTNNFSSSSELRRFGRLVYKKTLRLDMDSSKDLQKWENYSLDLADIFKQQPGALYRIELSFKQEYSTYPCQGENENSADNSSESMVKLYSNDIDEKEEAYWDQPYPYYSIDNYDYSLYDWYERDNPCHPSYYMPSNRVAATNVMASDLGIIVKSNSSNKLWISVSNLVDTQPVSNATITLYNYQLQPIGTAKTDKDGFAITDTRQHPFIITAEANGQKSYLRLVEGENNSLTRFDIEGKKIDNGLKGYIYGERGVWRPGDTLHVTFVLYDQEKRIPDNHPVSFEMYNPRGQFYSKQISTSGVNGFYTFKLPTSQDDPTGLWNGYIKVGGTSFHKAFRIETVKPNRLKVNLTIPGDKIEGPGEVIPVKLNASWLTGAVARELNARVEMKLTKTNTKFKGYEAYTFNNPASDFSSYWEEVFDGTLNQSGNANFNMEVPYAEDAPGMLNASIISRVYEPGGDASISVQSVPFSPYDSYVGLKTNIEDGKYIETDTDHRFDVVTLNADGKPVNSSLRYKIYEIGWSWWWENENESFSEYVNSSYYTPVAEGTLRTSNGKGNFSFKLNYPDWGRFLVYVTDEDSGHSTGSVVFIDWPSWRGRSDKSDPSALKMLTFSTDKTSYEVGEEATVIIPAAAGGTALVAFENGSSVLDRKWIKVNEKEDTRFTFRITPEMAPNFYIHISLLQPHAQTVNDLPIRLYGVVPVMISNKKTILEPQIDMPDVLRPETEFTVKVSEKNGTPMTYTLAIVDDGLLDLTNFKTPNPWNEFYVREALGIRTWDMYDYVMGAFAGKFGSMFSIGGDESMQEDSDKKANRFKPVVKFIGPFTLGKGKTDTHKITLPPYVGSVRTMVVAGQDGAYGKGEKTTPVRAPLMLLSSLPRVISTGEEITLPVNIFAMEEKVKNVSVKIETTGLLQTKDGDKKSVTFSETGDKMVYFSMKTGAQTGIEIVTITATGNGESASEIIEIDVRNPNPASIVSDSKLLQSGEKGEFSYQLTGASDDDWVKLEVSRIPSVDISRRFDFLYNYYHYCSEQLTSRALPLLYIPQFKEVDADEATRIKENVQEAIKHLYSRQLSNGGIVYWPGQSEANNWITSYAGSFLVLAKEKGYDVSDEVLKKWKNYQRKAAQNWKANNNKNYYSYDSELQQAYRLYTLALAGAPELGAMNRMKEVKDLSVQARWRLASAYALSGRNNVAEELVFNMPTTVDSYYDRYTYGSSYRDAAMILETLVQMGKYDEAFKQAQIVSKNLSRENSFSTQSTAYSLVAMGALAEKTSGKIDFTWTINGKSQPAVTSTKAIYQKELDKRQAKGTIVLNNNSEGVLYVNVVSKSKPIVDNLPAVANNLQLSVYYTDLDGYEIDESELQQGTDFIAVVEVTNISAASDYTDIALTHIVPSGWEIFNQRMTQSEDDEEEEAGEDYSFTYQDIRDDRVLTYFDLSRRQSKVIPVRLQATYMGTFVRPAIQCEAMYDTSANARTEAGTVQVVKEK